MTKFCNNHLDYLKESLLTNPPRVPDSVGNLVLQNAEATI
jgi:hypothetical protein